MLQQLQVENFAIAESVLVTFGPGFNVLTGETGAGKSIVIDAIQLLIGGRGSADLIRTGHDYCRVEASFAIDNCQPIDDILHEFGIEADDQLVITREILTNGRSRCRVNGRLTTVGVLARLGEHLVDLHGQHDHQSLLRSDTHLMWLDTYAGSKMLTAVARFAESWREYDRVVRTLEQWDEESRARERRKDLLQFQLEEIRSAALTPGEDEQLRRLRDRLANAGRLLDRVGRTYALISEPMPGESGAIDLLGEAVELLQEAVAWDPQLQTSLDLLDSAAIQAQEAAHALRAVRDAIEAEPQQLDSVEHRLGLIDQLARKYGKDVGSIIAYGEEIAAELDKEETEAGHYDELLAKKDGLQRTLSRQAQQLSEWRTEAALALQQDIRAELRELALENADLVVRVEQRVRDARSTLVIDGTPYACTEHGIDTVELFFSANPGEALRPLAKVASGGELSRLMLALKTVLAKHDQVTTLVFDEVDTGIGGRTAGAVAERLAELAKHHQVLVVTHLAQIASVADRHLSVAKTVTDGRTNATVSVLHPNARIDEIARMLDGTTADTTRQRAKELLAPAKECNPKKSV